MIKRFFLSVILYLLMAGFAFAGSILNVPMFQAFDDNGDPLTGGLLYSYIAGTTTAKALYTDKACTTPDTNPVVLDSRGEAEIYGTVGGYKLVLKTSADVTIWTIDNIDVSTNNESYLYFPDSSRADQGAATGGGVSTVKDLVDLIGTSKKATLVVAHTGATDTTEYTFQSSESIPSNIDIKLENGAIFNISTGVILTIYSPSNINCLPNQSFYSGDGSVAYTSQIPIESNAIRSKPISMVTDQTVTVGDSGDFTTINAAIEYVERFKPIHNSVALFTTIQLLSGFVMEEQVFIFNKDLSWLRITSVDAIVTIDSSTITTSLYEQGVVRDALGVEQKTNLKGDSACPAFCFYNSFAPNIAVLFAFDSNVAGDVLIGFQYKLSRGNFEHGAGCTDSAYRGLEVALGSNVWAQDTFWDRCGIGIRVSNASMLAADGVSAADCTVGGMMVGTGFVSAGGDFSGCTTGSGIACTGPGKVSASSVNASGCQYGLRAINGGTITANAADVSDCTENAILATNGGAVHIPGGSVADDCTGDYALYATNGGIITAEQVSVQNCLTGLRARYNGVIRTRLANLTGCVNGISTSRNGVIHAPQSIIVNCTARGVIAGGGSIDISDSTITGWTTNGIYANVGSIVIAEAVDVRKSGTSSIDDIEVFDESGCQIIAPNAIGGVNIRPNETTINGLVLSDTLTWITAVETPTIYASGANLGDVTHAVNTQAAKTAGYRVIRSTDGIEVFAAGNADADVWNYAGGVLAYTPS